MTGGGALAQLYTETGLFVLVFAREWIQEGTPLLKQALILKRRFRGKHGELELAILAADNMICRRMLVHCGG